MATSLGSLVVSLGLNAADYTAGLTKAELQAQRFAKNVNSALLSVGKVLGSLAIGAEIVAATQDIISSAAALNDLSDATGSSVENLSRLSNQAKIAGTDFATLQTLVLKLSVGMAGVDDEGSKAGQALKALGVTATDPVQALQEVALSLNKFEDGTKKAALAVALFGKQGPAFLATLKDIAELQDVGATVTKKQAEEAENLEKAWRRVSVESEGFKNAVLNQLVPSLLTLLEQLREGTKIAGGFWAAISSGIFGGLHPTDTLSESIARTSEQMDLLKKSIADPGLLMGPFVEANIKELDRLQKKMEFLKFKQRQDANALIDPSNNDARDFLAQRKPQAPTLPGGGTGTKMGKSISDAQRYLDSLTKQLEKTQDLTAVEQLLVDIREKRFAGFTDKQLQEAQAIAAAIDGNKALSEEIKKATKAQEEAIRAQERAAEQQERVNKAQLDEAEHIKAANLALSDEIAFIKGGEEALKAIERQRIQENIAAKESLITQLQLNEARKGEIPGLQAQVVELQKRLGLLKDKDVALQIKADADAMQQFADVMSDSFADAFEGFIMGTKSASQAFKDLANDIEKYLLKIALHKLGDQLFGGATSGSGDLFGAFFQAIAGMMGGGVGSGSLGLGGFARGTPYAPGGMAVVGEHGPELVDMPRGARVWPNGTGPSAANDSVVHVENHFHVTGTVNSQTVRQIERGVGDSVARNRMDR